MFYGTRITRGVSSWQIFPCKDGCCQAEIGGSWRLEEGAARAGVSSAVPSYRLLRQDDNSVITGWTGADSYDDNTWSACVTIPRGGLYRLETCLDAVSAKTGEHWRFRGDMRMHIGCGDVFVIAGQSNAAGYGKGMAWDAPDVRVHVKRNSGVWDMATHPLNDATDAYDCPNVPMGQVGTSPFLSFGKRHADYTSCPVGLIPAAQGGSPIRDWDPKQGGHLFRNMISKIQRAGGATAILWYQGCAEAMTGETDTYFDSFKSLVESTRRILGWTIPFYTFQLNGYLGDTSPRQWDLIRAAQRRAAHEIGEVYLLPTWGMDLADDIHLSPSSNVALGEQLAALMDLGVRAPDLMRAEKTSENQFRLVFDNVRGSLLLRGPAERQELAIRDEAGQIPVSGIRAEGDCLTVTLAREMRGGAFVSMGLGAVPKPQPVMDDATNLPAIPFLDEPIV